MTSARILAQAIWRIHTQQSVGWIFETLRETGELPPVQDCLIATEFFSSSVSSGGGTAPQEQQHLQNQE